MRERPRPPCRRRKRWQTGRRRPRLRRQHRSHTRRRRAEHQADQGRPPARSRRARADPGQARAVPGLRGERRVRRARRAVRLSAPGSWGPCTASESPVRRPPLRGRRAGKGTPDVLEAGGRLEEGDLNFVGNLEGFDLPGAGADVIVSDGFTEAWRLRCSRAPRRSSATRSASASARAWCRASAAC